MEKFKIPEKRIWSNLTHVIQLLIFETGRASFFGITDRNALVTSSEDHIAIATKDGFRIRCATELGYFPMEFITRISTVAAEFKASVASLFFDANDPLDP